MKQEQLDEIMRVLGTRVGEIERDLREEVRQLRGEIERMRQKPKPRMAVQAELGERR